MSLDIDKLKEQNQQELPKLAKPYQLAVYAIPEDQWEAFIGMMRDNLPLMPDVLELLERTASEHSLNQQARSIQSMLTELSKQAGKHQDESLKRSREMELSLEKRLSQVHRSIKIWLLTGFLLLLISLVLLVILVR